MTELSTVGLIAGGGRLPFLVAQGARKAGHRVVCVGLDGYVENALAGEVDVFYTSGVARPASWIKRLRQHGVTEAIMVGQVTKSHLFQEMQ